MLQHYKPQVLRLEYITRHKTGITISGLLFADNRALACHSLDDIQTVVNKVADETKKFGLFIRIKKEDAGAVSAYPQRHTLGSRSYGRRCACGIIVSEKLLLPSKRNGVR